MMTDSPTFVVYAIWCKHVIGITNTREAAEKGIAALGEIGRLMRIRSRAVPEDVESLLRGDRCESCRIEVAK